MSSVARSGIWADTLRFTHVYKVCTQLRAFKPRQRAKSPVARRAPEHQPSKPCGYTQIVSVRACCVSSEQVRNVVRIMYACGDWCVQPLSQRRSDHERVLQSRLSRRVQRHHDVRVSAVCLAVCATVIAYPDSCPL